MTVNAFVGLLAQKEIWNYEIIFSGFQDRYSAKLESVVPRLTEDGRVLLEIFGCEKGQLPMENATTVQELVGVLAQKAVWNYETKFVGFSDKYTAKVVSVVPMVKEDGKVLFEIIGEDKK